MAEVELQKHRLLRGGLWRWRLGGSSRRLVQQHQRSDTRGPRLAHTQQLCAFQVNIFKSLSVSWIHGPRVKVLKRLSSSLVSPGIDRLGRVSFKHVLKTLDYLTNETETSPVTEALLQLRKLYRLLEKRQENRLVSRMKVQPEHKGTRVVGLLRLFMSSPIPLK